MVGDEESALLDVAFDLFAVSQIVQTDSFCRPPCPYSEQREGEQKIRKG